MKPTGGKTLAVILALGCTLSAPAQAEVPVPPAPPAVTTEPPAADAPLTPLPANPFTDEAIPDRLLEQAEAHYFKREYVETLRALDMALQFSPPDARSALEAALGFQASGDAAGALLAFREAFYRFPKLVNIFIGMGFVRNETGDFYGAIKDFSTAIELMPTAYLAHSGRAEAKIGLDDYADAIEDFSVQIRAGHAQALERVYLKRGQAHLVLGNMEDANADFAASIRTDPKFAAAYVFHSYTLKYRGSMAEALAALNRAIELEPEFGRAFSARSWVHHELGNAGAALADADKCIALQPDVPEYILNRAMLRDMLEQPVPAREDYERAIVLANDGKNNVVWFYASFHLDLLSRRLEGKPKDAYLADALTWPDCWQKRIGLFLAGKIPADSLLKDAAQAQRRPERSNQECEAHYFVGMLSLLGGDVPAATRHFEQCVATNDLQTVELGLARLHLRRLAANAGVSASPIAH
jgi:tetratricopeptide (TPR) repeat protein